MTSSNTFTANMPLVNFVGERAVYVDKRKFGIIETEKGHFTIDATDEQINAITKVYYRRGGSPFHGERVYHYNIMGNPF